MRGLDLDSSTFAKKKKLAIGAVLALTVFIISIPFLSTTFYYLRVVSTSVDSSVCPVHEIKRPASFLKDNSTVLEILHDEKFKLKSVQKLAGAVQIDTVVFDNQPDVPDSPKTWEKFQKFHAYLQKTFPTVFTLLEVEYVNTYGLVFYWKGSDKKLKPLMLTAHQDVVPVQKETLSDWTYPPFEGHFDGTYLFGRGASDCKNTLIAILETFELLISKGFSPKRGVIAAFGFDEEASGLRGATNLAKHLEQRFGKNSMYAIIDEGEGLTEDPYTKQIIAVPGTAEKGYIDVSVELLTPGGHSSVPPDHTSIGIISELAYLIEKDPYDSILTDKNPYLGYLQCAAVHDQSGGFTSFLKKAIIRAGYDKYANSKVVALLRSKLSSKYLITTSQACDIVNGGEKVNALPESAKLIVNHRVAIGSSVEAVVEHFTSRVKILAEKHGLGLSSFGKEVVKTGTKGKFVVDAFSKPLNPAPVTPHDDTVWEYLAGATRHVFEELVYNVKEDGSDRLGYPIVLAPSIMTGNTDTKYYWNLTKNIFRYSPMFMLDFIKDSKVHSVDERLKFENHLQLLAFFYEYIQTVDTEKANNK